MTSYYSADCSREQPLPVRNGIKDIWNAHMAIGASYGAYDIGYSREVVG